MLIDELASRGENGLCIVTHDEMAQLITEHGDEERVFGVLAQLAAKLNQPVPVNMRTGPDTSGTAVISPPDWTEARLQGWIGAHHEELEEALGQVIAVHSSEAIENPERFERQTDGLHLEALAAMLDKAGESLMAGDLDDAGRNLRQAGVTIRALAQRWQGNAG